MKKLSILLFSIFVLFHNAHALEERFIDTGTGIIEDTQTGLMWTQDTNLVEEISITEAQEFADDFTLSGYNDWRAPSKNEVFTLLQGLYDFGATDLFREVHTQDSTNCTVNHLNKNVYLQKGGDTGFQYILCTHVKIAVPIIESASLFGLSSGPKIWLVRSGEHSDIRYTQQELDAAREDAYQHGLTDNSVSLDSALKIHIPTLIFSTPTGNHKLWVDFEFSHQENGKLFWTLKEFAAH